MSIKFLPLLKFRVGEFLNTIDKDLGREEIEFLFNKFDTDGNNEIDFKEFSNWLEQNDCPMKASSKEIVAKKKVSILHDAQVGQMLQ